MGFADPSPVTLPPEMEAYVAAYRVQDLIIDHVLRIGELDNEWSALDAKYEARSRARAQDWIEREELRVYLNEAYLRSRQVPDAKQVAKAVNKVTRRIEESDRAMAAYSAGLARLDRTLSELRLREDDLRGEMHDACHRAGGAISLDELALEINQRLAAELATEESPDPAADDTQHVALPSALPQLARDLQELKLKIGTMHTLVQRILGAREEALTLQLKHRDPMLGAAHEYKTLFK